MISQERNCTGLEVTDAQGRRGIVTDGWVRISGPMIGRCVVMWVGGRGPVKENRDDLTAVLKSV